MSEVVQLYESRNVEAGASIFFLFFFTLTIILFIYYMDISGYKNNMHVVSFVIFLIAFNILLFRDLIKPRLLLGESFIGIPKVTIFFRRTHKIIKFEDIKRIEIVPYKESKTPSKINPKNVFGIFIVDEFGKKYNLYSFKSSEKIIAKNLMNRMGENLWKEKLFVKPSPKYSLGKN